MIDITPNQIKKIQTLKRDLGWTDDNYHAALSSYDAAGFKKRPAQSCKDLDCANAARFNQRMESLSSAGSAIKSPRCRLPFCTCGHRDDTAKYGCSKSDIDCARRNSRPAQKPVQARKYDSLGLRLGMASPAQLRLVEALWAQVSRQPDAASRATALKKFMEREVCVAEMIWLEPRHIRVLVAALQAMARQKAAAA